VISVERVAKSKIGEARFWVRGLAISPPKFLDFWESAFPLEFSEIFPPGEKLIAPEIATHSFSVV
jgi:hypothetical protein